MISYWNLSIYYRAIAPYVLHGKIKRALYLDADILCLGNLNDLFIMNLPSVVGVVEDGLGRKSKKKLLLGGTVNSFAQISSDILAEV